MTHKQKEVVLDCAEATRTHLQVLYDLSPQIKNKLEDVLLGMEITATKLERLAEGS